MKLPKIYRYYLLNIILAMPSMAMEEELKSFSENNSLLNPQERYLDYIAINIDIDLPNLHDLSHSQKQIWYLSSWAHYPEYINKEKIMINNFYYQSSPEILINFINKIMPISFKTNALSYDDLNHEQLFNIITVNIDKNYPLAIYCLNNKYCHLTTIVGYHKDDKHILCLDDNLMIQKITLTNLLKQANLNHVISLLNTWQEYSDKPHNKDQILIRNLKKQLKKFTIIVFADKISANDSKIICPTQ